MFWPIAKILAKVNYNNTTNYTRFTTLPYSIDVLVQTQSLFTMPCSKHSKIAFILTHAIG